MKNYHLNIVSLHEEDNEARQGTKGTHLSAPQKHVPPVSLLLWRNMVAVSCFVRPPAL